MHVMIPVLLTATVVSLHQSNAAAGARVLLDMTKPSIGELRHFWDSIGLCPPAPRSSAHRFLLSQDEHFNLALIGSLPHKSVSQVRMHWLLDLITLSDGVPRYNFHFLDQLLDWLQLYGLSPGFELMGNPAQLFSDFNNDTQVAMWRHLVAQLARRYIDRYGIDTVTTWRFETWNEPDLKGYNIFNFTLQSYLRYYLASRAGLQDAAQGRLHLGGPAGLFKSQEKHPLCWGLLEYCSKQAECLLDFISFHKKGGGSSATILQQDLQLAWNISTKFPALQGIPLINDESDPLTGWSKSMQWRADLRYGAMVAAVIAAHQHIMVRQHGLSLELLSNDNAFLSYHPYYFSQRTLLARFQINNTHPPHVQFFRKPVYVTMALLSLLGNQELDFTVRKADPRLSVLAAASTEHDGWNVAVVIVFSDDTVASLDDILNVTIKVRHILGHENLYAFYLLDNNVTNPSEAWIREGAPVFPNQQQRARIRAAEGPHRARGPARVPRSGILKLSLSLSLPSIAVLHICARPAEPPGQVARLVICNVTHNEVLLFWSDSAVVTRCIKTYEVEFSSVESGGFKRINTNDTIFLSYQHALPSGTSEAEGVFGFYRVRAVDYWDRPGPYSSTFQYPGNFSCS